MQPLAVLNAIVFGSAAAITFGLFAVLIIYLVLQGRHPQLIEEFAPLLRHSGIFALLALVSGLSLYANLKRLNWRWMAQLGMWGALALTVAFYWPE